MALSAVFAAVIGFVPAVLIAAPAQAAAGDVNIDSDIEAGEADAFTFELRRTAGSADPLTLSYTTIDGTAEAGKDYTAISGTTSFPANSTRDVVKRFTVNGISDNLDEDDETFTLRFTGTVNGSPVTIDAEGILDDDDNPPTYSLSVNNPVSEGAGNARITATLSAVSGRDVHIPIATSDGTATAGDDYVATNSDIVVQAGQLTGTLDIPVVDDPYDEEDTESFTVTGSAGNHGEQRVGAALGVQIADNDVMPTVDVADPGNVTEGADLTFPVTLSAPSNRTVTVVANTVASTADGAATENDDYTPVAAQTVTFAPGDTSEDVVVHTAGDALNEVNPETLSLQLSSPTNALAGDMTAVGGITDDDNPPVVTLDPGSVQEGDTGQQAKTFTVRLDNPSGRRVEVDYHVTSGTATAGEDFVAPADGQLVFAPGDQAKTFTVDVKGDQVDEPDETFNVVLSNPGATATGAALGSNAVTITDDDNTPTLDTFTGIDMAEGDAPHTENMHVSLSNPSSQPITLDVTPTNGTAVSDGSGPGSDDFDAPATTVTIPAGALGADIPVQINGDSVYEGTETASIAVDTQNADPNVVAGNLDATIRLTNDDAAPTVQLNASSGAEGDTIPVTASVTGVSQDPIAIGLTAEGAANSNGSDAAQPEDFDATNLNATQIPGGNLSGPVPLGTIDLAQDHIDENAQTVRVSMTGAGTVAPVFITITDDPNDMLPTVTPGDASVGESDGTATVPVTLDFTAQNNDATSTERTITAHYATADGTAKTPGDYTATSGTVTFNPGDDNESISVPITSDNIFEHTEAFTVGLSTPNPAETPIAAAPGTVTVADDDAANKPGFTLTAPADPVAENAGTADFTLRLSSPTAEDVDFTVALDDDTAKHGYLTAGNDDFTPPAATVTIPAGQQSVTIPVPVKDDNVYEDTETANLRVDLAPGESDAVGTEKTAVLTIADNDPMPTVALSSNTAAEGGSVTVSGTVTGMAQDDIHVNLAATGASNAGSDAAEGSDFDASNLGAATIPGGTTGTIQLGTIDFADDHIDENDETVRVTMTGLGTTAPAWQTITDDPNDMAPEVSVADDTVGEGAGTAHIPVTLDFDQPGNDASATERTVTVHYATADGTAKTPADYTAATAGSTVSFTPGQLSSTIDVPIVDDNVFERPEAFTVTLSNPAPGDVTVLDGQATVGITDNDSGNKPSFSVSPVTVGEGDGTANVTVQLSGPTAVGASFDVAVADGTAQHGLSSVGGNDYVPPVVTRVTVPAGASSVRVPVTIVDDNVYEGDESADVTVSLAPGEDAAVGNDVHTTLTIQDNDAAPTVTLVPQSGTEGTSLNVNATVTGVAQNAMTFDLGYAGDDSNGANPAEDSDYTPSDTVAVIPAGTPSGRTLRFATIALEQDDADEPVEAIRVTATDQDGVVAPASAIYKINDDPYDLPPSVSISSESIGENEGSVELTLSLDFTGDTTSTEQDVVVPWSTVSGTARAGQDFTARSGTATIAAGDTSTTINVPIIDDDIDEPVQTFAVRLGDVTSPAGATVADGIGTVNIQDDDAATNPALTAPASRVGPGYVTVTGTASEGASVHLWVASIAAGDDFNDVATTTADNNGGRYSFTRYIPTGYRFYTRSNGLNSAIRSIKVTQVPVLTGGSTAKGKVTLTVTGSPKGAGQTVRIQVANASGSWTTIASGTTGTNGSFTKTLSGYQSGTYRTFRAWVQGDSDDGTYSGYSLPKRIGIR